MASILAVHGIGQQFKGNAIIHSEWWPALTSGLHIVGRHLSDPAQLDCAFYGHLFRKSESLGASASVRPLRDLRAAAIAEEMGRPWLRLGRRKRRPRMAEFLLEFRVSGVLLLRLHTRRASSRAS